MHGSDETLLFADGTVTLLKGKVVSCEGSSPRPSEGNKPLREEQSPKKEAPKPIPAPPPPRQAEAPPHPVAAEETSVSDWQTDYARASADAAQSHRYMLLDFTGSDWCHFCIKLDSEVLSTPEFKSFAASRFICVKLDFPQETTQSADLKKQNAELAKTYAVRGYPTIILLSPDGKLVGRQTGYRGNGPRKYIEQLNAMMGAYEQQHAAR